MMMWKYWKKEKKEGGKKEGEKIVDCNPSINSSYKMLRAILNWNSPGNKIRPGVRVSPVLHFKACKLQGSWKAFMFSTCLALWVFKLPETKSLHVEQMGDELYVQPRAGPAAAPSLSWSGRRWRVVQPCPSLVQWAGQKGWHPAGSGCVPASNGEKMYGWILNGEGDMRKKGSDFFFSLPFLVCKIRNGFHRSSTDRRRPLAKEQSQCLTFFSKLKTCLRDIMENTFKLGGKNKSHWGHEGLIVFSKLCMSTHTHA